MWYDQFQFYDKLPGLTAPPAPDFFTTPFTEAEKAQCNLHLISPELAARDPLTMPAAFNVPAELLSLLQFSDGGGIINGSREFGYFSLEEIRTYYLAYGFPEWTPLFMPIALNGGGVFYAYDFRDADKLSIVAVSAGNLGYDDAAILGDTLQAVLQKDTNIEDELYGQ